MQTVIRTTFPETHEGLDAAFKMGATVVSVTSTLKLPPAADTWKGPEVEYLFVLDIPHRTY